MRQRRSSLNRLRHVIARSTHSARIRFVSGLLGAAISSSPLISLQSYAEPKAPTAHQHAAPSDLSPAMLRVNKKMHQAIRGAIADQRSDLGPLIIFEAGKMKLLRANKEVAAFSISPPLVYQQLKVLGHMAFAAVIQLRRSSVSDAERKRWAAELSADASLLHDELPKLGFSPELESSHRQLIERTITLLALAEQRPITIEELRRYSIEVMPALQAGIKLSARAQVDRLHAQAQKIFALLNKEERAQVRAHLYGGRGARVGNINIQYLSWLFGERTGKESGRIVFSENIREHDAAMDSLARYMTERELARLIFADPGKLDRDLLSDETRAYLETFEDPSVVLAPPSTTAP